MVGREWNIAHRHVDLAPLGLGTVPLGPCLTFLSLALRMKLFPKAGGSLLQL